MKLADKLPRCGKAFTLVELLVVVAIIALLASILMPSLKQASELAKRAVCIAQLDQIGISLHEYAAERNHRMPPGNSTAWPGYGIDSTYSTPYGPMGLAILVTEKYEQDATVLYCPRWQHPYHRYGVLDHKGRDPVGGPNDYGGWPKAEGQGPNRHRGISYHYRSTFGLQLGDIRGRGKPPNISMDDNPTIVADHWSYRYVMLGKYGHNDGYNRMRLDGSASWLDDPDHEFLTEAQVPQDHGDWGKQEFLWQRFFDDVEPN